MPDPILRVLERAQYAAVVDGWWRAGACLCISVSFLAASKGLGIIESPGNVPLVLPALAAFFILYVSISPSMVVNNTWAKVIEVYKDAKWDEEHNAEKVD